MRFKPCGQFLIRYVGAFDFGLKEQARAWRLSWDKVRSMGGGSWNSARSPPGGIEAQPENSRTNQAPGAKNSHF
jgi:hypothetical protein